MVKVGRNAQLMVAEESTYGTFVTPDRSYEFRSEGLTAEHGRIESQAIRKGERLLRSDRWAAGQLAVSGDVTAEIAHQSFGLWLKHALGAVATSNIVVDEVWEHLFTLGQLEDKSLTAQVGLDDVPKAYTGIVVTSWTLSISADGYALLQLSLAGQKEDTDSSLASVSYPSPLILLPFTAASLNVGGSELPVSEASITCENQLATDRYAIGSKHTRRPAETSRRNVTAQANADFPDLTTYNRVASGDEVQLVLDFAGPQIGSTGENHELKVTANVRTDGATPTVGGFEEIRQEPSFKVIDPGDGSTDLEVLYRTTDETP